MTRTATGAVLVICLAVTSVAAGLGFGSESAAPSGGRSPQPTQLSLHLALSRTAAVQVAAGGAGRRADWNAEVAAAAAAAESARLAALAEREAFLGTPTAARSDASSGALIGTFDVTCYTLSGTTASGAPVSEDVVAVDPAIIPLGSRITIEGIGTRTAADTGGSIQGYRLDIWMSSYDECVQFGHRTLQAYWA